MSENIPEKLQLIIEDFEFLEGDEKLMHLLELSERLPDLPDRLLAIRDQFGQVHECMSPVFIHSENTDGKLYFYFDIPREAPTVRGYGQILSEGLNGLSQEEILAVPDDYYRGMGLHEVITGQRLNGMSAILAYMKNLARENG